MLEYFQISTSGVTINSNVVFFINGFPVTNSMVSGVFMTLIFLILAFWISRFNLKNPGKSQLVFEMVIEMVTNFINQMAGSVKLTKNILILVVSLVVLILISNLMTTILPFMDAFFLDGQSFFRTYTADFNTTLVLAIVGVIATHIVAIKNRGFFGHVFSYIKIPVLIASIKKGPGAIMQAVIEFMVGTLDIISEISRLISLSLRLFGNLYAGVILLGVFGSFLAIGLPIPIILLGVLSGVIQAVVFGALVTSYIVSVSDISENQA